MIKETVEQIRAAEQKAEEKEEQTRQTIANDQKRQEDRIDQQTQAAEQRLCAFQQQEKERKEEVFQLQREGLEREYEKAAKDLTAAYDRRLASVQDYIWKEVQKTYGYCQDGEADRSFAKRTK